MNQTNSQVRVLHFTECLEGGVAQAITRWISITDRPEIEHFVLGRVRDNKRKVNFEFKHESHASISTLIKRYLYIQKTLRPEVIHIHSTKAGIIARLLPTRKAQILYSPHCYAFLMRSHPRYVRWILKKLETLLSFRTDVVVAVSPFESKIAQAISTKSCKVILEPNIANPTITVDSPQTLNSESTNRTYPPLQIRAVGRYCEQKNPHLLAEILSKAKSTGLEIDFEWIGSPDSAETELELPISGWKLQSEVEQIIASVDLLIHTASWEAGVPLVALDAINAGTPTLLRKLPEYEEILESGSFDTKDEAVAMLKQLISPDNREQLIKHQIQELTRYFANNQKRRLENLYLQSIEK